MSTQGARNEISLTIREAVPADAHLIGTWFNNFGEYDDFALAGGNPAGNKQQQIESWLTNSQETTLIGFVFSVSDKPAAYIDVQHFYDGVTATQHLEVGHLVVNPTMRRQPNLGRDTGGVGTVATLHVIRSVHEALDKAPERARKVATRPLKIVTNEIEIYMRVLRNNPALPFVRRFPFREIDDPRSSRNRDQLNVWFVFRSRKEQKTLGRLIQEARTHLQWERRHLAYFTDVEESMIAAVEQGVRKPSAGPLRDIAMSLTDDTTDQDLMITRFLFAFIQEPTPPRIRLIERLKPLSRELQDQRNDLWIVSDTVGEVLVPALQKASREAVEQGFSRIFFIPRDERLADQIMAAFDELSEETRSKRLKIYYAPNALCAVRFIVKNPSTIDAEDVLLIGPEYKPGDYVTVPLEPKDRSKFVSELALIMAQLDRRPNEEIQGFLRYRK